MTLRRALPVFVAFGVGCGGGGGGSSDGHVDAVTDVGPDAFCGADFLYTGEYVDWDSSISGEFLGIFNATWAVQGDTASRSTAHTAPNGRFLLCIPTHTDPVTDITPDPTDLGSNGSDAYLPGVALGNHTVLDDTSVLTSARSMRMSRVTTMFEEIGSAYDPTAGQLFAHLTNTTGELSITGTHAATQAYGDSMAWSAGDTGTYVFFPNVALGSGASVTLSSTDATAIGTGTIPLVAGKLTYVEIDAP